MGGVGRGGLRNAYISLYNWITKIDSMNELSWFRFYVYKKGNHWLNCMYTHQILQIIKLPFFVFIGCFFATTLKAEFRDFKWFRRKLP